MLSSCRRKTQNRRSITKKVLLIGDSTRMGYDKYVKLAFQGVAEIFYPKTNCCFTSHVIRYLHEWKSQLNCGDDVDLVHWNVGLWDDLIMPDGFPLIPLDVYTRNIERICRYIPMLFPQAKVIFATSTPIQEELFTICKRYNVDTEAYNAAAVQIARQYGAEINDLYTLTKDVPKSYYADLAHFYTKEGTELLANQVISVIEKALEIQATPLDYEALFSAQSEIRDSNLGF